MMVGYRLNMIRSRLLGSLLMAVAVVFATAYVVRAQTEEPTPPPVRLPVHVVEDGENLTYIAQQYDVTIEALRLVNHLRNADVLVVGQELVIPGGEGENVAAIYRVQTGDSLAHIASRFDTSTDAVMEANLMINRDYVPAVGEVLSVISQTGTDQPRPVQGTPHFVTEGETLLEIGVRYGLSVSQLIDANDLAYPIRLYPGQRLRIPGDGAYQDLPGKWVRLDVSPQFISQGDTVSVYVENQLDGRPTGQFSGQELRFVPKDEGFVAIVGIDAFTEPGRYALEISGSGDQPWHPFVQDVPIFSANFSNQEIIVPEELEALLDPEIREEEDAFLYRIYANFSEEGQWDGLFQVPVTDTIVTAPYGGGRSYNEGPITIYHTGTDFGGDIGTPILAAANGTIVFNDMLELRGRTVIIDHGLGVMTGYYHLADVFVEAGDTVSAGQPVGLGGSTGLSTGPHLHWDLRIMGVPVDAIPWTEEVLP
jgi:murein DD-endopeptidase MepM/ murein hydrolase activator NlpD